MNITPGWTDERCDALRKLAAVGLSAAQIGAELGVTRNTIIGKVTRMGILLKGMPTGGAHLRRKPPAQRLVVQRGKNNTYGGDVEMVDMPEITDLPPDQSEFACTIIELEAGMCRFPMGDTHDLTTFRYCGAEADGPWCPRHRRIVFTKPEKRER